jgi:hypothetical protein
LGGAFRDKREKVTRGWRKLRNEELHNLYSSLNMIKSDQGKDTGRWSAHVARIGVMINIGIFRILAGKHEGKRPVGRLRRRWYNNIKIYTYIKTYGVCVCGLDSSGLGGPLRTQ